MEKTKPSRRPDLMAVGALVALYVVMMLFVSPLYEAAPNDEVVYGGGVKYFLETGILKISGISGGATMLAQVLWGALFAWLGGGFSFGALHVSSLALSFLVSLATYLLCREMGVDRKRSFLGAAVFALNPIAFNQSYVFMAEIPTVAFSTLAVLFYLKGIRQGNFLSLFWGSLFTFIAFWVRPYAVLIPAALLLFYLVNWKRQRPSPQHIAIAVVFPLVASALSYSLYVQRFGNTPMLGVNSDVTRYIWTSRPIDRFRETVHLGFIMVAYLGLFLLPLAAGLLASRRNPFPAQGRALYILLALWVIALGREYYQTNAYGASMPYIGHILNTEGLGLSLQALWGQKPAFILPSWGWKVVTAASFVGSLYMGVALSARALSLRKFLSSPAGFIALAALLQVPAIIVTNRFLDRFLLVLLPLVIALLLETTKHLRFSEPAVLVVLAFFTIYAVLGTQDYIGWNVATWSTAKRLAAQGIPADEIDGGLSFEYWNKIPYSEDYPQIIAETRDLFYLADREPDLIPMLIDNGIGGRKGFPSFFGPTGVNIDAEYVISFTPLQGFDVTEEQGALAALDQLPHFGSYKGTFEVVERLEYPSYWGHKGELYVLRRIDKGAR